MDIEKSMYPLSRYWYSGDFRFYYAYGNTQAQDFLQNITGEREPEILVLGCGDIRSCFYSLWKNFDVWGPARFDGVHFVLNDISAAVLARNILFLYLCLQMPEEENAARKWLSGMWAIWYCHELHREHYDMLNESLHKLCHHCEAWSSHDNPLYPLVKFTSPATQNEVLCMWKMWLSRNVRVKSVREMLVAREKELNNRGWAQMNDIHAEGFTEGITEIPFESDPSYVPGRLQLQKSEVLEYLKSGSVYAENVLELDLPTTKTFINYTFYERQDGTYNVHYRSLPFSCYHQVVQFTTRQLRSLKKSNAGLLVKDSFFASKPFLANSVQQFSLWLRSSHKLLCSKKKLKLSFTFDCSHALTLCYEMENTKKAYPLHDFHLIYSSNLMDHLGPPNLILSAIPLLKDNGLLFTTSLYKLAVSSFEEYLAISFGFDCKFFPLILGVRCVNHEGERYASPVTVKPSPVTVKGLNFVYRENLLIWEKLPSNTLPLTFSDEPLTDTIAKALLSSVEVCVYSLLKTPKIPQMITNLCVETAVKVFHVFMSNTCAEFSHSFWKPLTYLMKRSIKPFLSSMQTHLFLHGIHMHLTVSKTNCPLCLQVPLSESVGLFTITFYLKEHATPKFMAIVHKEAMDNASFLCTIALQGGNVHIFDCVSPSSGHGGDSFLQLYFYAPLKLVHDNYKVTIIISNMSSLANLSSNKMYLPTQPLGSLLTSFASFKFYKTSMSPRMQEVLQLQSFGTVTSHVSDGDTSETDISVSHHVLDSSTSSKLRPQRLSSSALRLSYGKYECQLKYPYPFAYDSIKITLKRKQNEVHIQCPRAFQPFEDEKPLFIISPDKPLSLSYLTLSMSALETFCGQQLTRSERNMKAAAKYSDKSLTRVKEVIASFLQRKEKFFRFVHPDNGVMVLALVNQTLFDYENKVPVVDLAFCFLEESFLDFVVPTWIKLTEDPSSTANFDIDDKGYELLKTVLEYFAARTNGTCNRVSSSSGHINLLIKEGIQKYFTRAVISLLLCDPDDYTSMIEEMMALKSEPSLKSNILSSVTVKTDYCDNCGLHVTNIRICSNCRTAKYCTKKCQRLHWPTHKLDCKINVKSDAEPQNVCPLADTTKKPTLPPFPLTRYWYGGDFNFYYAYGNTPAEDFLQNCPGVKEPSILLLGCGDIRSCFYTLWRNFDSSIVPHRFNGVHFVLNDWSLSVLARNIVFLYLCLTLPKDKEKNTWLCAMWAIWYCHELYAEHQKVLDDCLKVLLKYSQSLEQWASTDNPMQRLVKFTSPQTLDCVAEVWRRWLERNFAVGSVQEMYQARYKELFQRGVLNQLELYGFSFTYTKVFINGDSAEAQKSKIDARMPEVIAYIKCGNCYAENVIKNVKFLNSSTTVNFTLYERPDGVYTLHYGSIPYCCYYHAIDFSPDALASAGVDKSVCEAMLVESKCFKSLPFLANSVQQFCLWVWSASKVLNNSGIPLSFTFNDLHAVSFCQELQQSGSVCENQFDLIHASNLMDHLGPSGVILSSIPLLKSSGLLFTTTLISKRFATTVEDYLSTCIGFDCKLLPVVLGVRCVNHEGVGYCSPVSTEPIAVGAGDIVEIARHERMLIWEKVEAQSLVLSQLPPLAPGNVTDALFDFVKVSALSILTSYGTGQAIMNNNSLEGAVTLLQLFLSSVSSSSDLLGSHHFWEPLSTALRLKLKPFLNCLQTQAILHGLHVHFTPNKEDCPKCLCSEVEEKIGLFCAKVPLPIKYMTPHFVAFVHKHSSSDAQYLCNEGMAGKDVHFFDCFDGQAEEKVLKLKFFAPLKFVAQSYKVTLGLTAMIEEKNLIITALPTASFSSMQVKFMPHSFFQAKNWSQSLSSNFGELTSHTCDGNQVHSEIHLSEAAIAALTSHKLNTKQISSQEIQLRCGALHYNLQFKYPINYDEVNIKLSKAKQKVEIISKRLPHKFEEEKSLFVVIPDHQLSLPPQPLSNEIMVCHSSNQMYKEEREIVDANFDADHKLMTPLLRVKKALMFLFQANKFYFHVCCPHGMAIQGLVVVNQVLFDYHHNTPALDLAFCFLDSSDSDSVLQAWRSSSRTLDGMNVVLNSEGYDLLQKTFHYFASRTFSDCHAPGKHSRYQLLVEQRIDQHFKRAVVYLLYRDPDRQGLDMISSNTEKKPDFVKMYAPKPETTGNPAIDKKCDYCGKHSPATKKCTKCRSVCYCSKECQTKHWPVHGKSCKAVSTAEAHKDTSWTGGATTSKDYFTSSPQIKCSYCKKASDELKKCLRCEGAQYCGKECQASHWPEHKDECKRLSRVKSKPMHPEHCGFCGGSSVKLLTCTNCGKVKYCGKECQRKHWKDHKKTCKQL